MNSPSTLAPSPTPGRPTSSAKGKRVSRACVSCRVRKTRCDLDAVGSSGRPPCQRCVRQDLECILAPSRRGGRRVRKPAKLPRAPDADPESGMSIAAPDAGSLPHPAQHAEGNAAAPTGPDRPRAPSRPQSHTDGRDDLDWDQSEWTSESPPPRDWVAAESQPVQGRQRFNRPNPPGLEGHMASADLLNPSDALNLLAQVADLDPDGRGDDLVEGSTIGANTQPLVDVQENQDNPRSHNYPPLADGCLSLPDISVLVRNYHKFYHPYFPVAPKAIFDDPNPLHLIRTEPHLLTAILIVASKDEKCWCDAHQVLSRHMESLISKLIYGSSATVGAVEALLILAEWATQRPQENPAIGRGEEDHSAWMLVGVAIRLGYLQRLEQSALPQTKPDTRRQEDTNRRRLAWTACYMSDRQLSTRLGKGFWARGPPPSTMKNIADFPTLQAQKIGCENLALLFQANLELTQLFGNTHDILYSSTSHREQLYMGGEYIRYIDDFTSVLRNWKLEWGSLSFTPHIKASLLLSFDFLRLYINAFAFQATLNRAVAKSVRSAAQSSHDPGARSRTIGGPLFTDLAGNADARFIYESLDAANSLLSTFNGFIDPVVGLKYMPLKYYLYVIYAAVFLFKARFAGAISKEAGAGVRRAVHATINRLQKTSHNPHSLGHRYARSLRLLWWKSPEKSRQEDAVRGNGAVAALPDHHMNQDSHMSGENSMYSIGPDTNGEGFGVGGDRNYGATLEPLNGLSWRDLDSLGQFIANHTTTSLTDGTMTSPEFESQYGSGGMEGGAEAYYYDSFWQGNDIIF